MRVGLIASTSGATIWLAGNPSQTERQHSSAADISITGAVSTENQTFVRGTYGVPRDRGNLTATISFSTTRLFDSAAAAELFALTYDTTYARTGTLVAEVQTGSNTVSKRYLRNAVVSPPARQVIGCTVLMSYTVTGSNWQTTRP